MTTKYTDAEEYAALTEGAGALRDMAQRLDPEWGEGIAERRDNLRRLAAIMDEMADCYAPVVRDPESWQAVAAAGRRFA